MIHLVYNLFHFWDAYGAIACLALGGLGLSWCGLRWYWVEREDPLVLLRNRFDGMTRRLLLHRRSRKTFPVSLLFLLLGVAMAWATAQASFVRWVALNGGMFVAAHVALTFLLYLLWSNWDREPKHIKAGDGTADARLRDVAEEWGTRLVEGGKTFKESRPVAELLVYRNPSRLACRIVAQRQHLGGYLTLLSLRWDILCRHIFVVGPQGSGKTASIYGPIMLSSQVPWIYNDSKAELPFRDEFPDRPVFGLDVRGHETRSGIWNPLEEIRSAEDFDILVDYVFPKNPKDPNGWVRDMAREIFGAVLRARRWESIQELARTLRESRLEPFMEMLSPIYQDTMKEPKSQVPVLQDLVVTLSRWETMRVRDITEGRSTLTLDDFITRGGYLMNCEDSDALKGPVQVFLAMLLGRLRNRSENSSKLLLLLDEFGDCGRIPGIQKALVLLRSKGVAIVAAIQNMGLLQDVYPQDWRAVMEGFGTRIWLARNLEDDLRQRLSQAIGKFTRRVPAAHKQARETEKEADLLPLDAWGRLSELRLALGRLHGFTYWFPVPISIPPSPLGRLLPGGDPWGGSDAELRAAAREALKSVDLPDWCLQVPEGMAATQEAAEAPTGTRNEFEAPSEEEWL